MPPAALLASALMLTACASAQGEYPSLAVRDVERAQGQFEPVAAQRLDVPEVAVDTMRAPADLAVRAGASHDRFLAALGDARRAVSAGRGAASGSEAWGAAQVALADLESIRSDTAIVLADLDTLHVANDVTYASSAALDAARAEVLRMVAEEDAALAELRAGAQ